MSERSSAYSARSSQDLDDLSAGHPLAWVTSAGPRGSIATPLPLLLHRDGAGRLIAVEGHFARMNPHVAALRSDPIAQVLWLGVQGYVSPSWLADRTQAPSWNYASAQCRVHVRFDDDDGGAILRHLRMLAQAHEAGRPRAWSIVEMGARLESLAERVISFRAEVLELHERYKLGQDERDDVLADLLTGLDRTGQRALADWMRRFNPGRGTVTTCNETGGVDAADKSSRST